MLSLDDLACHLEAPNSDLALSDSESTTGDERRTTWQEAFRRIHEDIVADIKMFYMVGYTRVGPRVDFTPDISTNSELQVSKIKFKG